MPSPWRRGGRGGTRRLEKGYLKYLVLRLLSERPRHGYELLRAFEERFGGHYVPSPGVLYPALQLLEELGYVAVQPEDGRKVYRLTAAGQRFLESQHELVERAWHSLAEWVAAEEQDELHNLVHQLIALGHLLREYVGRPALTPQQIARLRAIVARARQEIEAVLAEPPAEQAR